MHVTPFIFYSNFISSIITFTALLHFIMVGQLPLLIIHFVKCRGLSLGDKEATQLHALLFVCELNNVPSGSSPTEFERNDVIGH